MSESIARNLPGDEKPGGDPGGLEREGHWSQFSLRTLMLAMPAVAVLAAIGVNWGVGYSLTALLAGILVSVTRDRWATTVMALYALVLVCLTCPVIMLTLGSNLSDAAPVFLEGIYWIWLLVMLLCQAALLAVPVKMQQRRPVRRRKIFWPILAAGLLMGAMMLGAIVAISEFLDAKTLGGLFNPLESPAPLAALFIGLLVWLIWTVVFFRLSRRQEPADVVTRQCGYLLKGSILELLVAVPTHVFARHRGECCAGAMTFVGITFGISVMFLAFGPAVYFLFVARWQKLRPSAHDRGSA